MLDIFTEFRISVIKINKVSKSLNITFKISQIYDSIYSLENLILLYGLGQLGTINFTNKYLNKKKL